MGWQRKKEQTHFHLVLQIENALEKVLVTIKRLGNQVNQFFKNRTLVIQRYNRTLAISTVLLVLINFLWPTSAIGKQFFEMDKWIETEVLTMDYLTPDQAKTRLTAMLAEMGKDSAAEAGPRLKLKSEYQNGAYVRESASLDAHPLGEIRGDETVQYLGEANTDDDGRTWYKVETDAGVVGWVSGKVVEQVQ